MVYFRGSFYPQNFLAVDVYNMNGNQVSLAVMLWLSGVVVDQSGIYLERLGHACGNLLVDHRRVNVFIVVNIEIFTISTVCLHSA